MNLAVYGNGLRVGRCNDIINHVDCVMKRDVYPQKMHSCSKNIRGILFLFYKYPWYIKIYIIGDIAWIFA